MTSWAAQGTVLVVGGGVVPFPETLRDRRFLGARRRVKVGKGHDVGGNGRLVGVLDSRYVEGPRDEVAGYGVGGGWRLNGMKRASIELGWVVLISATRKATLPLHLPLPWLEPFLDFGSRCRHVQTRIEFEFGQFGEGSFRGGC